MIEWQINETITYSAIGLGWLIAVICIFRRHSWEKGQYSCLAGDLISATFTTITFGLVINLSLVVYIDLKHSESSNASLREQVMLKEGEIGDLTREVSRLSQLNAELNAANNSLSSESQRLINELANDTTIIEDLVHLWRQGELDDPYAALQPVLKHFGENQEFEIQSLQFSFPTGTGATVECGYDGGLHC